MGPGAPLLPAFLLASLLAAACAAPSGVPDAGAGADAARAPDAAAAGADASGPLDAAEEEPDAAEPPDARRADASATRDASPAPPDASDPDAGDPPDSHVTITGGLVNPDCPANNSEILGWSFPERMEVNTFAYARLSMRNTGTSTWSDAKEFKLGDPNDGDPFYPVARLLFWGATVPPGGQFEWVIPMRAPPTPESYLMRWRMVEELVCWFGQVAIVSVQVTPPVATGQCAAPAPPPLAQVDVALSAGRATATALVAGADYCSQVGFLDGRALCTARPEGHPDLPVCDELLVGRAADTGRVGPTWTLAGQLCGPNGPGACANDPADQFAVTVAGSGLLRACGNLGPVCGELAVP